MRSGQWSRRKTKRGEREIPETIENSKNRDWSTVLKAADGLSKMKTENWPLGLTS